ncbi:MAG: RagB/SusD family nutrient uptake outer membrane protein [Chitinophagaceae bacterium]
MTAVLLLSTFWGCKKYVEIDLSPNLYSSDNVFLESGTANSAIAALYSYYPTTYTLQNFTFLADISSDEMHYTGSTDEILQFEQNTVGIENSYVANYLWLYPYTVIRYANQAIDGLTASTTLVDSVKNQLLGEAKFIRGWLYFNMANFFGKVPLVTTSEALENAEIGSSDSATIYAQVVSDLVDAESKLSTTYTGTSTYKIRANKWAAAALLARVYLYQKNYASAITEASKVINSGTYTLATPANAFIYSSSETILQFATTYGYSSFSTSYRTSSSTATVAPPTYVVDSALANSFDDGDLRKTTWIDSTTYNSTKYYRNYKYKLYSATAGNEYNVFLRLSEVYLIRAEAELLSGDLSSAITDINVIRSRAGLSNFTGSTTTAVLNEIIDQRNKELFGEFGQRWFDLKRWGLANSVLGTKKTTWTSTAVWMPIPYAQIILNPSLTQNDGY